MNFVAHYFVDRTRTESLFAIGAATPDLLSIYNPELRIKKHHLKHLASMKLSEDDKVLVEGINKHFLVDAIFHSSEFFQLETKHISNQLEQIFPEGSIHRKYFVAHVLLELMLDKVLIQDYPELLPVYYEHFKTADTQAVKLVTEKIAQNDLPRYENFLEKFVAHKYLYHYTDWNHIIYVLKRIMRRVTIDKTAFTEHPDFVDFMMNYEIRLEHRYPEVMDEIARHPAS